jgi:hypothetical protein
MPSFGKQEKIEFWMPNVLHMFRSGHRICGSSSEFVVPTGRPESATVPWYSQRPAGGFQKGAKRVFPGGVVSSQPRGLVMD